MLEAKNKGPNAEDTKFYSIAMRLEQHPNFGSADRGGSLFDEYKLNDRDRTIAHLLFFDGQDNRRSDGQIDEMKAALLSLSRDKAKSGAFREMNAASAVGMVIDEMKTRSRLPNSEILSLTDEVTRRLNPVQQEGLGMQEMLLTVLHRANPLDLWEGVVQLGRESRDAKAIVLKIKAAKSPQELISETGLSAEELVSVSDHVLAAEKEMSGSVE